MAKYKEEKKESLTNKLIGLLFIFILAIVPCFVGLKLVPVSEYELEFIRSSEVVSDFFSYNKMVGFLFGVGGILLLAGLEYLTKEHYNKPDIKKPIYVLGGIYLVLLIISTIFSSYPYIAFHGISERYEGFWVWAGYIVVMFSAYVYVNSENRLKYIVAGLFLTTFLTGLVGFFQYFGKDFFATDLAAKLVLGSNYSGDKLTIKFAQAFATLYNPNCLGLYSAMLLPFMLSLAVFLNYKNMFKYVAVLASGILFVDLIASGATGGVVSFVLTICVLVIVLIIYFIANKKFRDIKIIYVIGTVALVGIVFSAINFTPAISEKIEAVKNIVLSPEDSKSPYLFRDYTFEDDRAVITLANGEVSIVHIEDNFYLVDKNDQLIMPKGELEDCLVYDIEGAGEAFFTPSGDKAMLKMENIGFLVAYKDGRVIPLGKKGNELNPDEEIKSIGFEGMEHYATGRGYIWSRSIPVMLDNLFIGSGPDTYALEFPQNDVTGKLKYLGNPYVIVDKPHNAYLQIGTNTGVLSLIVLLALFLIYITDTVKCLIKKSKKVNVYFALRFAFLGLVLGYLFGVLTTDSVISVSPVFWVALGAGFGLNRIEDKVEKTEEIIEQ